MHDRYAPYWAIAMVILLAAGLSTISFDLGDFMNGYMVDIAGPAWTYILFRGLFTAKAENLWTRLFTPGRTFIILLSACLGIEALQYFEVYPSTFDPWDLAAYISVMLVSYILDRRIYSREKQNGDSRQ